MWCGIWLRQLSNSNKRRTTSSFCGFATIGSSYLRDFDRYLRESDREARYAHAFSDVILLSHCRGAWSRQTWRTRRCTAGALQVAARARRPTNEVVTGAPLPGPEGAAIRGPVSCHVSPRIEQTKADKHAEEALRIRQSCSRRVGPAGRGPPTNRSWNGSESKSASDGLSSCGCNPVSA